MSDKPSRYRIRRCTKLNVNDPAGAKIKIFQLKSRGGRQEAGDLISS